MADIAGDTTTSATISVGTEITNAIEILGDHDWYRLQLTAGEKVSIAVNLDSMEDSYLYLRNASGTVIAENDDGGGGRGSRLVFTAPSTGTYFVDVAAWTPEPNDVPAGYTGTGSYTLSVNTYVTPPVGTLDDFAYQMTHGFFGGDYHHFDVTQGGTITVNFQGITDAGRAVALQALQQWTDIIGVNFVETAGDAQITFDDLDQGTGAFADTVSSNHITSSAIVNVAPYRLNLHTYMHEIGHALGIGHTSNSNAGTAGAVYPDDAIWRNDGAAISIMSYFDNGENAYYANLGFSNVAIMTPQVADIIAMGNLYGLSTITRTGDTTYGFNNNSGRDAFDAALHPNVSYTIFDSGGVDTLDYSGFASNQLINLNAEAFSNIGALVGNVVIARGTIIENARGGTGADTIVGNGANNALRGNGGADHLSGGGGNDALYGGGEADILNGGEGSDVYVVASASEHPSAEISDSGSAGFDELRFEAATAQMLTLYAADTGLERITLGTPAAHGVDASGLTNAIDLIGNRGDNRLFATAFADRLIGDDGDDRLFGESGNDRLYGEAGVDRLYGGTGNDIYIVRDATDYVYESAGEGADRVYSAISHALRSNVEELRLQGSAAINGYGGLDDNLIYGNSAANKLNGWGGDDNLYGEGGNDRLYGTDGDDRLFGELGNDRLDGGAGVDRMYGGGGDDIYIGRDTTDYAIENAGEGMDTVYSFETHILRDNVETLRLSGSAAINGWGNAGDDTIVGNGAANRLVGQGGDDRLFGGHGDDRLYGDEGNDRLDGGRGSDLLFGGSGSDDFLFRNGDFASDVPSGADRITDFSRAEGDRLHLSSVDANSAAGGNQAFAFIGTGDFTGTAGDLRYEQLSGSTYVSGDTNGDGVADFMIRLDGLHTLGSGDFVL